LRRGEASSENGVTRLDDKGTSFPLANRFAGVGKRNTQNMQLKNRSSLPTPERARLK